MEKRDRFSSLFYIALSAFVCWQSVNFGLGTFRKPGPGLFPFLAGLVLGFFSIIVFFESLLTDRLSNIHGKEKHWGPLVLTYGSLVGYALLVGPLGFNLITFLFLGFLLRVIEKKGWFVSFLVSLGITVGAYIIFGWFLQSQLPKGRFGF